MWLACLVLIQLLIYGSHISPHSSRPPTPISLLTLLGNSSLNTDAALTVSSAHLFTEVGTQSLEPAGQGSFPEHLLRAELSRPCLSLVGTLPLRGGKGLVQDSLGSCQILCHGKGTLLPGAEEPWL
jgi:hypothetical protein